MRMLAKVSVAAIAAMTLAGSASAVQTFARYTVTGQSFAWTNEDVFGTTVVAPVTATIAAASVGQSGTYAASLKGKTVNVAAVTQVVPATVVTTSIGTITTAAYTKILSPAYKYVYANVLIGGLVKSRTRSNTATVNTTLGQKTTLALTSNGGNLANIPTAGNLAGYSTATAVQFSFLQPALVPYVTNRAAYLLLSGVSVLPADVFLGGAFVGQFIVSGNFSIVSASNFSIRSHHYSVGESLLSGSFSNGIIAGGNGATSGAFSASTAGGGTLSYVNSNFLNFDHVVDTDLSVALTSITPGLGKRFQASSLTSFKSSSIGEFSSDPAPVVTAVPEPEVWGLMVVGFGMVGMQVRRRSRLTAIAA